MDSGVADCKRRNQHESEHHSLGVCSYVFSVDTNTLSKRVARPAMRAVCGAQVKICRLIFSFQPESSSFILRRVSGAGGRMTRAGSWPQKRGHPGLGLRPGKSRAEPRAFFQSGAEPDDMFFLMRHFAVLIRR